MLSVRIGSAFCNARKALAQMQFRSEYREPAIFGSAVFVVGAGVGEGRGRLRRWRAWVAWRPHGRWNSSISTPSGIIGATRPTVGSGLRPAHATRGRPGSASGRPPRRDAQGSVTARCWSASTVGSSPAGSSNARAAWVADLRMCSTWAVKPLRGKCAGRTPLGLIVGANRLLLGVDDNRADFAGSGYMVDCIRDLVQ